MKLMASVNAPLGSPAFITPAIFNLQNSSAALAANTQRLTSGNRIINAGDNISGFSVAARLQSQLTSLKQASSNIAQGTSLLQVASGGLLQISDVLGDLKTLAIQANSASLTNTERGFLQQQFTGLFDEIDSIVSTTTFNGITLLDGTLAGGNQLLTQSSGATKATGSFTFTANPTAGQSVVLNGVTFLAGPGNDFAIGVDESASAANLAAVLTASTDTAISQNTYQASGATIVITAKTGGTVGNNFIIDKASSTTTFSVSGDATQVADTYLLSGGLDNGLNTNSTKATGTIGDTVITAQNQTAATVTFSLSGAAADGETLQIDNGNGGLVSFTFRNAAALNTEIQIGATTEETLQNIVSTLSQYDATNDSGVKQLEYTVNAGSVTLRNRTVGNPTDLSGAVLDIAETVANGSLSAATFNNGTTGGINVSGVSNSSFTGAIQGFTATYVSPDVVDVSLTVGSSTYSGRVSDTTPAGDTTVRLSSTSGGFFDLQLAAGQGTTVGSQANADTYATRLNSAIGGLDFYQERLVTNYSPTGDQAGSEARLQRDDASTVRINSVSVSAPGTPGADATIDFVIGDSIFRASSGLGGSIGAYETVKFTNLSDSNEYLSFTNGATAQDFSTAEAAATFETALTTAFHIGTPGNGTDFQVGSLATDVINVSLGSASSFALFNGVTPDVSTQANAAAAQTTIDTASDSLQSLISTVGGKQSSFSYAAANVSQSITGIGAAHSALADTDIVAESADYAQNTLKVNAGIAIIAQAIALPSSLLVLVQATGKN